MQKINEEFDEILMKLMQKLETIDNYFDTIFGFLFRKTNFFSIIKGKEMIEFQYNKYLSKYQEDSCKEKNKIISLNLTQKLHIPSPEIINKELKNQNLSQFHEKRPKRPATPFFLFSQEIRKKNKEKLSIQKINEMWGKLKTSEKEKYQKEYEEKKRIYEQKMQAFEEAQSREEELNKKNEICQAVTLKEDQMINNERACNCGICEECKNYKKKKEEKNE